MKENHSIELYQPTLQRIAHNILGSVADAEDIVQETLLKWLTIEKKNINNPKFYLIKTVKNNCINHLKSIQNKKEEYLNYSHYNELFNKFYDADFFKFDFENELKEAINILHKKLGSVEQKIFILKELFDVEYVELQKLFDKKKDNCRQLISRAKSKLKNKKNKYTTTSTNKLYYAFKNACNQNDPSYLINHFEKIIKK